MEKTTSEKQATLEVTRLKESELGKRVMIGGVEKYSHIVWVDKVEKLAADIPDTSNLLMAATRKSLPAAVRKIVGSKAMMWKEFCNAVREILHEEIQDAIEEVQMAARIQESLNWMTMLQNMPSKALGTVFHNFSLSSPIRQPQFIPRNVQTTAAVPSSQNPFMDRLSSARMNDLVTLVLPIYPNMLQGQILYKAQVMTWMAMNAGKVPNEIQSYPLSPSSALVVSDKCWTCGC